MKRLIHLPATKLHWERSVMVSKQIKEQKMNKEGGLTLKENEESELGVFIVI